METATALLIALLSLLPHSPGTACVRTRIDHIAAQIAEIETTYGVPPGLTVAICWRESWCGCHPASGGSWGAPRDARHRNIAGPPNTTGHILQVGFEQCGSWFASVTRFRSGHCVFRRLLVGYEPIDAIRLAQRVYERAGLETPNFR